MASCIPGVKNDPGNNVDLVEDMHPGSVWLLQSIQFSDRTLTGS